MVVDCGNRGAYNELFPILDRLGITTIDIFVMSHSHVDHIGSFAELARNYTIKKLYKNYVAYKSSAYLSAMHAVEDLGIETQILYAGDSFKLGDYVTVDVLWPFKGQDVDITVTSEVNQSCLAMRITYGESSFWTSGDLYIESEKQLVEIYGNALQSDIMKLNHHSKLTSNCPQFIDAVSPIVAVAMQNECTNKKILRLLTREGILAFHTFYDGSIKISTKGDGHYKIQSQYVRPLFLYGAPSKNGSYSF